MAVCRGREVVDGPCCPAAAGGSCGSTNRDNTTLKHRESRQSASVAVQEWHDETSGDRLPWRSLSGLTPIILTLIIDTLVIYTLVIYTLAISSANHHLHTRSSSSHMLSSHLSAHP